MTQSSVKHRTKAEWPSAEAQKVLGDAIMVQHDRAVAVVETIRDQLFGNADKMETLANKWGRDKTMTKSKDDIDDALTTLSGYWQGGGFDSFSRHSLNTSSKIEDNESKMNGISDIMTNCIRVVYNTYRNAVELISTCAHDLASFGIEHLIPGAGQLVKILNVLNDFVKAWEDLFAKSLTEMGQLMADKVTLRRLGEDFKKLSAPGEEDATKNPDLWTVKPNEK